MVGVSRGSADSRSAQRWRARRRYTGELAFLTVYAAGAPIKAIEAPAPLPKRRPFWFARIRRSSRPPI